jgi:hypothetical protein
VAGQIPLGTQWNHCKLRDLYPRMKSLFALGLAATLILIASPTVNGGAPATSATYSGIIGVGGDAGDQGGVSLKITSTGQYTLRAKAAGIGFSHKGDVPDNGVVSDDFVIKLLGGFIRIQTHLEFTVPADGEKVDGSATFTLGSDTATLNFTLYKAFPYTKENPAPQTGRHVMLFTPAQDPTTLPGRGVATVSVSPKGLVRVIGTLADGSKINCGGQLTESGIFPILNVLYKRKGFIGGFGQFAAVSEVNVLDWARVTSKGDPIFRGNVDVEIYPYTAPAVGSAAISFGNQDNSAPLGLSGGGLTSFPPVTIQVTNTNKVIVVGENEDNLKLTLNKKTGLISGTIKLEIGDELKKRAIKLIINQAAGAAQGFFISPEPLANADLGVL